ncbi:MAG: DUF2982 domain-containing protein [Parashewanella sp.]
MNELKIYSNIKRNGHSLAIFGATALLIAMSLFIGSGLFGIGLILFTLGAISLILGIAKIIEPEVTFEFTENGFVYFHRRGKVTLTWDNIQRIDIPRVISGIEQVELPYVGIKLKRINAMLDTISPRLATGLLTEQRSLMMTAGAQSDDEQVLENHLNHEFMPLTVNEERYRGVLGMFGRRCLLLNDELGYHFYIPRDSADRELTDFVQLLRQKKANSL